MISSGQERLREIVKSKLPDFRPLPKNNDESNYSFFKEVKDLLRTDPVITSDTYTSRLLGYSNVSPNYIDWCDNFSTRSTKLNSSQTVYLDRFIYTRNGGSMFGKPTAETKRYEGGEKWTSTISCLFGLAEGKKLSSFRHSVYYYPKSKILKVDGGGNHRTLAHVLWGEPVINPDILKIVEEEKPDEELFEALLDIDHLFPSLEFGQSTIKFEADRLEKGFEKNLKFLEEANLAKSFHKASDAEKLIIKSYHTFAEIIYGENKNTFKWLYDRWQELRSFQDRPKGSKLLSFFRKRENISSFEKWYNNHFQNSF
jgi:hypothetical protein